MNQFFMYVRMAVFDLLVTDENILFVGKVLVSKVPVGKVLVSKVLVSKVPVGKVPVGKVPVDMMPIRMAVSVLVDHGLMNMTMAVIFECRVISSQQHQCQRHPKGRCRWLVE